VKPQRPPVRIGLTGGIGSGKSTVAGFWVEAGAALIDTDAISRALTAPGGAALPAIAAAFGPHVVNADEGLVRSAMRELVFADPAARQRLEAILHPMISAETARAAAAASSDLIVFDVPCWWNRAAGVNASTGCWWWIALRPCKSSASCSARA